MSHADSSARREPGPAPRGPAPRGRSRRIAGLASCVVALVLGVPTPHLAAQNGPESAFGAERALEPQRGLPADVASLVTPEAGTIFLHPERFEKQDGTLGEVHRGVLFVPVNRSNPEAGTLGLELWRFPAADEATGDVPPVFVLRGGPGWPGLGPDLERDGFYEENVAPLARLADVVYVGQRGIGSSRPNTMCEAPAGMPDEASAEERRRAVREAAERCRDWWTERGVDLAGFTVLEAAADVDAARRALGYETIIISGGSFGSHWGMAVLRFHPEIVERAVLTGMEGPNHTYDSPTGVLNVLVRIAEDAESSPRLRDRVPEGGLVAALRRTIEGLEEEPVAVPVEGPGGDRDEVRLDGEAARELAEGYLGSVDGRRWEASWPAGVLLLDRGDYDLAARDLAGGGGRGGGFWTTASFFQLDCGSGISADRESALLSDPARQVVPEQNWFYRSACPAWEADLGEEFRRNFDTEIPTVIVHGNWDFSTPLENALELVPHFRNGHFVLVERGSHGAMGEAWDASPEFREALLRFVETGDASRLPERVELPEPYWVTPEEAKEALDGSG